MRICVFVLSVPLFVHFHCPAASINLRRRRRHRFGELASGRPLRRRTARLWSRLAVGIRGMRHTLVRGLRRRRLHVHGGRLGGPELASGRRRRRRRTAHLWSRLEVGIVVACAVVPPPIILVVVVAITATILRCRRHQLLLSSSSCLLLVVVVAVLLPPQSINLALRRRLCHQLLLL